MKLPSAGRASIFSISGRMYGYQNEPEEEKIDFKSVGFGFDLILDSN